MKKFFITAMGLLILFTGCTGKDDNGVNANTEIIETTISSSEELTTTNATEATSQITTAATSEPDLKSETTSQITTAATSEPDFRDISWNMSKEEVMATEKDKPFENIKDILVYSVEVAGHDADLGYRFENDKLVSGMYLFRDNHTNDNLYIDDFKDLKEKYTSLYGEPKYDREIWEDDLFKDDPNDYGLAISAGHLRYYSFWETNNADISLLLSGDNFKIKLCAVYNPVGYIAQQNTDGL